MGKDAKAGGGKGKGKQSGGSDEASSKGKGKAGKAAADGLGTCTYVKESLGELNLPLLFNFRQAPTSGRRKLFWYQLLCCRYSAPVLPKSLILCRDTASHPPPLSDQPFTSAMA
ncbi:unnamed protein product [Brassica oleracea var. botrytis]|uniref:(rape) hypothetical protein n=1 Tax=Brassica napus TaxID=3708 RepID=A0A816K859_BRANA|nr:unnamed protein product [Brassica napus]